MADEGAKPPGSLFEALAQSAPDVILTIDAGSVIRFANRATLTVLGWQPGELVGKHLNFLIPERYRARHDRGFGEYLRTGRRTIAWTGVEFEVLTKGGAELPVEVSYGEFTDATGSRLFSGFIRDTSEKRRHADALAHAMDAQHRQAQVLDAVEHAVITTDTEGTVLSWNHFATTIYGWTESEAVGRKLNDLLRTSDLPREPATRDAIHTLLAGKRVRYERQVRRKDGEIIWVSVVAAPISNPKGEITSLVGTSIDVTERHRLEEQLHQAQKLDALGRLAGGVAHDFNNLLTVIASHAELLLMDLDEHDPSRDGVQEIMKAADRGARLTRQLLAFSKPTNSTEHAVAVNELLSGLRRLLARLLDARVRLTMDCAPDTPDVIADPGKLEQVIVNLVVNARDAMPAGGTLRIVTRRSERPESPGRAAGIYASITVHDEGTGMTPEVLSRIFEPFFTTKPEGKGTGLGLATAYAIVKQFGGYMDVESTPGRGSTFTVCLPAAESATQSSDDSERMSA